MNKLRYLAASCCNWMADKLLDLANRIDPPWKPDEALKKLVAEADSIQTTMLPPKSWSAKMHDIYGCPYNRVNCHICKTYL